MEKLDAAVLRYLVNGLWQPILIVGAGLVADAMLRRGAARFRCWLWILVLLLCVIGPAVPGRLPVSSADTFRFTVDSQGVPVAAKVRQTAGWITMGYGFFVLCLLGRFGISLRAANRWKDQATAVGPGMFVSELISAPLTFGFRQPSILLPRRFAEAGKTEMMDAVVAHEQAHIERNDFAWNAFLLVITAPVRFHPVVWLAQRRMALVRELACDELASSRVSGYLAQLVEAAVLLAPQPKAVRMSEAVGLGLFDCDSLEERVMKLKDKKPLLPVWAARTLTAGLSLALLVGTVSMTTNQIAFAQKVERVGKDVTAPKLIFKVEPSYEPSAREDKIEGPVLLQLVVNSNGLAEQIVVKTSLDPRLDKKAIEAVQQWRFKPGTKDGEPVNVEATIQVNFRLL